MTLRLSSLVLGCAALLMASQASAQQIRPSNTPYLTLRGGATVYGGELDGTGSWNPDTGTTQTPGSATDYLFENFSWLAGAELGYQFTESLGFGVGFNYANYSKLDEQAPPVVAGGAGVPTGFSEFLPTVQAAFRYMPLPRARFSPYTNFGAQFTFGKDGNVGNPNDGGARGVGMGPYFGLGFDLAMSPRVSLFIESNFGLIFDDWAVDGLNPGANTGGPGAQGDATEFDVLGSYGGGLRFNFRGVAPALIPVDIEGLQCPSELFVGEAGSFMAMTNADATAPVTTTWNFGDGGMGATGMSVSRSFSTAGTYTVTAMSMNGAEDSESCLVTVRERPVQLALTGCRATPSTVDVDQQFTVNGTATGATSVRVDFGDGTTASALPATHSYSSTGAYTVTITATGANGATQSCNVTVNVGDQYCTRITDLNSAFFGFNAATLTADARARLDENIEILRRCPQICVNINGYTDDQEGDQTRLSQRRADAVRDYYVSQGIDASRLRATGRGQDPNANSKEDPGPGDSRARRADSIPTSCSGF